MRSSQLTNIASNFDSIFWITGSSISYIKNYIYAPAIFNDVQYAGCFLNGSLNLGICNSVDTFVANSTSNTRIPGLTGYNNNSLFSVNQVISNLEYESGKLVPLLQWKSKYSTTNYDYTGFKSAIYGIMDNSGNSTVSGCTAVYGSGHVYNCAGEGALAFARDRVRLGSSENVFITADTNILFFANLNDYSFGDASTATDFALLQTMGISSTSVNIGTTTHTVNQNLYGKLTITGNIVPAAGNTYSIGTSKTVDFKNIYSRNAVTTGSDERIKENIADIPDEVLDVWEEVKFREFNFKDLNNDRVHLGVIAQQVLKVFQDHNLDPAKYTFFCYDKWDDEYEDTINEDGVKEHKLINPAGDLYSIRYTDLLIIEAAYQRRKSKQLEEKNKELEDRIKRLEEVLGL